MSDDPLRDFIAGINAAYKGEVMEVGGRFGALTLSRFSSGVLSLDTGLGGGWPFSRVVVLAGNESTGKTLLALKAAKTVMEYDHKTHKHRDFCKEGAFIPGRCLFVDLEGTFDLEWAKVHGWDDTWHAVARPEYAEQAIDIITAALEEGLFDLIVLDSVAMMSPTVEIESSTEDWQVGLAARLVNKAMRKWTSRLNKMAQGNPAGGPMVLCLNQFRVNIGQMFGDPRTLPGGMAQRFCASIIIYTKSAKVLDGDDKETATVELGGVCYKNKTYIPRINFAYEMGLREGGKLSKGMVDNLKQIQSLGQKYRLIQKVTEGSTDTWRFGKRVWPTRKALMEEVERDPGLWRQLWRSIVAVATEKVV
jgi:recombination protein RecA